MPLADAVNEAVPSDPVTALPPDSTALAPDVGAVNVTVAPLRGAPHGSVSLTVRGLPNAVPTAADCVVPDEADKAGPTVFKLTSLIVIANSTPGTGGKLGKVSNSTVEMPPALSSTPMKGAELSPAVLSVPETS